MATYNRPGVYVNELPLAAAPGNRVSAAVAAGAVMGAFAQGPDSITLVTSWYDFTKKFGGYNKQYPASFAVAQFFRNGGTELFVKRVLPTAAKKVARVAVPYTSDISNDTSGTLCTIAAKHRGIDGNNLRVVITPSKTIRDAGYYDISVYTESGVADYVVNNAGQSIFTPANAADDVLVEQFNGVVFHDELSGDYAPTVLEFGSALIRIWEGQTQDFNADGTAINPLADYKVKKNVKYIPSSVFLPLSGANTPEVDLTYEDYTGDNVFDPILMDNAFVGAITAAYGSGTKVTYVTDTDAAEALNVGDVVDITDLTPAFNGTAKAITDVVVSVTTAVTEVVSDGTSFEYTAASHNFVAGDLVSVTGASSPAANVTNYLVTLVSGSGATKKFKVANTATLTDVTFTSGAAVRPAGFKVANTVASGLAVDGAGVVTRPDTAEDSYVVDDLVNFKEFEIIDQPLVFFLPDVTVKLGGWAASKWVYKALIDWIESPATQGRHFLVVETAAGLDADQALSASGDLVESSRAAVYYPHVFIKDPVGRSGGAIRKVGPSGAVAGQFLATDRKVGPFKAAAGVEARVYDAIALERAFSPAELDALNSGINTLGVRTGKNVVNAIRNLPGAGIVIMGARTLKQDGTANRYINMRRSLTYIEKRLHDLAQFAVFENNTEKLWARLITVLGSFLNDYRNQGGLRGTTLEQSFYIKCDGENNTSASIAAGEVHVEIGVALEYPAEFVVINLSQKTAE
jgi:phage tail sheath protein FI